MKNKIQQFIIVLLACLSFAASAWAQESRPRLGLSVSPLKAPPILLQHLKLSDGEGLIVENIVAGSELEAAGLSQGDIVLAIDGIPLSKPQDLTSYIKTKKSGEQITLDVIQKGDHRQIYTKLDNLPDEVLWKYAKPVTGPGKSPLGNPHSSLGQSFPSPTPSSPSAGVTNRGSAKSVFQSMIYSDGERKISSVTIDGSTDDPNAIIEIKIGDDAWKTTIGEIDKLPDEPKTAAQNAIQRAENFAFGQPDDLFQEMMKRQQEQLERMHELWNRQAPTFDAAPQTDGVPQPSMPSHEIRS